MDNAIKLPIILGRSFLATRRALIDVNMGKLTFRIGDETQDFNVFSNSKMPTLDACDIDAKMVEPCCILSTNLTQLSLGDKESKEEPSAKPRERSKRQNQESTPSVKESNNLEMCLGLNIKIKKEYDVLVA